MEKEQKPPGIIERLDNVLLLLSEELITKTGLMDQAVIRAKISNIILIKREVNKGDCFYCWKCIKSGLQKINPIVWIGLVKAWILGKLGL